MKQPSYDLRVATRQQVIALFEKYHGYKSASASMTYCFAVFENDKPVAAYAWQPPPPGAAKSVCPEAPQGVLSLSLGWSRCRKLIDVSNTFPSLCDGR